MARLKRNKQTKTISGEIWVNKAWFIHCLSRRVVFRCQEVCKRKEEEGCTYITYKPHYSPHCVSDHSINPCVSENCKSVKQGWARGQTGQLETNQNTWVSLRWQQKHSVTFSFTRVFSQDWKVWIWAGGPTCRLEMAEGGVIRLCSSSGFRGVFPGRWVARQ